MSGVVVEAGSTVIQAVVGSGRGRCGGGEDGGLGGGTGREGGADGTPTETDN